MKLVPWAIVTSGTVPIAHGRQQAAGLPEPKHWVTFEKVSKGKPDPEPFYLVPKHFLFLQNPVLPLKMHKQASIQH